MPERKKGKLRRGLLVEVNDLFDGAEGLLGAGDPAVYDDEKVRLRALRREVLGLLRRAGRAEEELVPELLAGRTIVAVDVGPTRDLHLDDGSVLLCREVVRIPARKGAPR